MAQIEDEVLGGSEALSLSIQRRQLHPHARFVAQRLIDHGFETHFVGGVVRDLLLGRKPKDFDVVTAAQPQQVMRLFEHARLVGRRFVLVHVRFPRIIVEVSTYRAPLAPEHKQRRDRQHPHQHDGRRSHQPRDNRHRASRRYGPSRYGAPQYGTPQQDAQRRDFTVNALLLHPSTLEVCDLVGGLDDLRARRLCAIGSAQRSFREDPVRMLRALRFEQRLGFALGDATRQALIDEAGRLAMVNQQRLAEEVRRVLWEGQAAAVFATCQQHGLLAPLLRLTPGRRTAKLLADPRLWRYLARVDASCRRFRDAPSMEADEDVVVEDVAGEDDPAAPIARAAIPGPAISEAAVLGWLLLLASPLEARPWLHPRPDDDLRRARMRMRILFDQWGLLRKRMGITFRLLLALRSLRLDSSTAARAAGCAAGCALSVEARPSRSRIDAAVQPTAKMLCRWLAGA